MIFRFKFSVSIYLSNLFYFIAILYSKKRKKTKRKKDGKKACSLAAIKNHILNIHFSQFSLAELAHSMSQNRMNIISKRSVYFASTIIYFHAHNRIYSHIRMAVQHWIVYQHLFQAFTYISLALSLFSLFHLIMSYAICCKYA